MAPIILTPIIETYIPNPLIAIFPGAKLGLSNIITLISLIILGVKNKCIVSTLRIILTCILHRNTRYNVLSSGQA